MTVPLTCTFAESHGGFASLQGNPGVEGASLTSLTTVSHRETAPLTCGNSPATRRVSRPRVSPLINMALTCGFSRVSRVSPYGVEGSVRPALRPPCRGRAWNETQKTTVCDSHNDPGGIR